MTLIHRSEELKIKCQKSTANPSFTSKTKIREN